MTGNHGKYACLPSGEFQKLTLIYKTFYLKLSKSQEQWTAKKTKNENRPLSFKTEI